MTRRRSLVGGPPPPNAIGGGGELPLASPVGNHADKLVAAFRKARGDFDHPPPCCASARIVSTAATTDGREVTPAKVCLACGAWRFSIHVEWTPAVPPDGFGYPDGAGLLLPKYAGPFSEHDRARLRALADKIRASDRMCADVLEHEASLDLRGEDDRLGRARILIELADHEAAFPENRAVLVEAAKVLAPELGADAELVAVVRSQIEARPSVRIFLLVRRRDRERLIERLRIGLAGLVEWAPRRAEASRRRAGGCFFAPGSDGEKDPSVRVVLPGETMNGTRADVVVGSAPLLHIERQGAWWDACLAPRLTSGAAVIEVGATPS